MSRPNGGSLYPCLAFYSKLDTLLANTHVIILNTFRRIFLQLGSQNCSPFWSKMKYLIYWIDCHETGDIQGPQRMNLADFGVTPHPRPTWPAQGKKTVLVYIWECVCFPFSVFRNGDLLCPPFRFIIPRTMRQDLEQILGLVTEKVSLRTGAVRRSATAAYTHTHTYAHTNTEGYPVDII